MAYEDYNQLKIKIDRGVAFVTIDNPPINLMDFEMGMELIKLAGEVAEDDNVKVIVFDSANPDFFIAHFDVGAFVDFPDEPPPRPTELNPGILALDSYRTMPKISIAKIEGMVRGGGSEFVLTLDMRFGAIGKAVLGQPEVGLGLIPGSGGTQHLPRLMGRSRALEVLIGCGDFTAEIAERYGYINRALPPDELTPFVENLAYRIASFPAETIALCKKAVTASDELSLLDGLLEESYLFAQSTALKEAKRRMKKFLEMNGQTRDMEINMVKVLEELGNTD